MSESKKQPTKTEKQSPETTSSKTTKDEHADGNDNTGPHYKDYAAIPVSESSQSSAKGSDSSVPIRYRKLPAKLNSMLSTPEFEHDIISWMPHGRSWRIHDTNAFIRHVLPKYFDYHNFNSFIRLVNAWGFRRKTNKGPDQYSYYHECFLRHRPDLHGRIRRLGTNEKKPIGEEPNFFSYPPLPDAEATKPWSDSTTMTTARHNPQPQIPVYPSASSQSVFPLGISPHQHSLVVSATSSYTTLPQQYEALQGRSASSPHHTQRQAASSFSHTTTTLPMSSLLLQRMMGIDNLTTSPSTGQPLVICGEQQERLAQLLAGGSSFRLFPSPASNTGASQLPLSTLALGGMLAHLARLQAVASQEDQSAGLYLSLARALEEQSAQEMVLGQARALLQHQLQPQQQHSIVAALQRAAAFTNYQTQTTSATQITTRAAVAGSAGSVRYQGGRFPQADPLAFSAAANLAGENWMAGNKEVFASAMPAEREEEADGGSSEEEE